MPKVRFQWLAVLAVVAISTSVQGEEIAASKSVNVMKAGPRSGENGGRYFNIQGKNSGEDGKYAAFGVLDFTFPKTTAPTKPTKLKSAKLMLTQSVARFAKEGQVKFLLSDDFKGDTAPLKFDAASPNTLGTQLQPTHAIGEAAFKAGTTGQVDTVTLDLNGASREAIKKASENAGTIRIVVVPADGDVAATYFGAGNATESNRPKLSLEFEIAK